MKLPLLLSSYTYMTLTWDLITNEISQESMASLIIFYFISRSFVFPFSILFPPSGCIFINIVAQQLIRNQATYIIINVYAINLNKRKRWINLWHYILYLICRWFFNSISLLTIGHIIHYLSFMEFHYYYNLLMNEIPS